MIFQSLTAIRILPSGRQKVLSSDRVLRFDGGDFVFNSGRAVRVVPHDGAICARFTREALARHELVETRALMSCNFIQCIMLIWSARENCTYVRTLSVDAVNEQFYGSYVIAGHKHPGCFFQAVPVGIFR